MSLDGQLSKNMLQLGMTLRNIQLIFSLLIIGFCLTLYFQPEQVQNLSADQYRGFKSHETRSFSLAEFNQKIAPAKLEDIISEIHEKNKMAGQKTRVMEIGFGSGRTLMELKKKFPDVEFYGLKKEKTHNFYRRESFIHTAIEFNIMTTAEAEAATLPYLVFQELDFGTRLPYDENKFDLVYSQATIPQIRYTFELFNEIMRILKKGGISLHSDVSGINIYFRGVILPLKDAMKEFRKMGIEIYVLDNPQSIRFRKPSTNRIFPVTPHLPIPSRIDNLPSEQRRPEMNYNLNP
jgi:SAM-dependent methyltransferase